MAHKIHYTQLTIVSWVFLTLEIHQQKKRVCIFVQRQSCFAMSLFINETGRSTWCTVDYSDVSAM